MSSSPSNVSTLRDLTLALLPAYLLAVPLGVYLGGLGTLFLGLSFSVWTALFGLSVGLFLPPLLLPTPARWRATVACCVTTVVSIAVAGFFFDFTSDAFIYHKPAIAQLLDGWNPFATRSSPEGVVYWSAVYPKASWIIGAQLVALTGNLEHAKAPNFLALLAVLFSAWRYVRARLPDRPRLAAAGALLIGLNPVAVYQLYTSYVDGLLVSLVTLQALALAELLARPGERRLWFEAAGAAVIAVNLKFTGLAYAGLAFAFFLAFRAWRDGPRAAWPATLGVGATLAVAMLVCGKSPYADNLLAGRHLLHPLGGRDALDFMPHFRPANLNDLDRVSRFLVAHGSRSEGVRPPDSTRPRWPFLPSLPHTVWVDTEAGGYGPLFFEGLIVGTLALLAWRFNPGVGMPSFFLATVLIVGGFIHAEAWWARYSPQLFLPPLLVALAAARSTATAPRLLAFGTVGLLSANVLLVGILAMGSRVSVSLRWHRELAAMRRVAPIEINFGPDRAALHLSMRQARIDFRDPLPPFATSGWLPIPGVPHARWRPLPSN